MSNQPDVAKRQMEPQPKPAGGVRVLCHVLAGVLALGHFVFLMGYFEPAISTPDANGYYAQATRIARDGRTWLDPESPIEYVGMHWLKNGDGRYYSRYPAGFPLVLAVPFKLGGTAGAMVLNPLMCSLTLVALYLLCVVWVGAGWGLVAAALLAVNPTVNEWALGYFAHTAAAFFFVWGIYFLARWELTGSWKWGLAAGVFLGVVPSVRYPEGLFCAAAGLFVLLTVVSRPRLWRSALVGVIAAGVPIGLLLAYNYRCFGSMWRTAYALTNEQTGFSWEYFTRHAVGYLEGLSGAGAGVLFGLGLAGMAGLCVRRKTWRHGVLLATLVVPVTVLYMSYYWSGGPRAAGSMRFMVPTIYVYAVAGVWLLSMLAEVRRAVAVSAALVLLV